MKNKQYRHTNQIIGFITIIAMLILGLSCREDDLYLEDDSDIIRTALDDWNEETHGNLTNPDYQVVFDHGEVIRFDIVISPDDWSDMQADLASNLGSSGGRPGPGMSGPGGSTDFTPIWVPASIFFNDTEWYHVGVRYKGNSSLTTSYQMGIGKLSFKLDFDEYEDDYPEITNQRFYGFRQLNLKNNYDDASLMREKVASDLFREFGLVSPRTAFCVVYLDHGSGPVYYGVYTLVEEVDDTVLESQFGNDEGNLYKPDGAAASFASGSFNESQMEKKNNEELADYSDVYYLYTTINSGDRTSDEESWKAELNDRFDVDAFLQWLASNTTMQNWDTYGVMTHNYYLYNNPDNGLLTWIPWDNNEALQEGKQGGALGLSLSEVNSYWPLIRYLVDIPEYREIYKNYLGEFTKETFKPDRMSAIYSQYYELLKDYAYAEEYPYSFIGNDAEFNAAVEELNNHVQSRYNAVISYIE